MFFLFRCLFWLGIVFYWMPWTPTPAGQDHGSPGSDTGMSIQSVLNLAPAGLGADVLLAKAEEACRRLPAECLAAASHLPHLTQASLATALSNQPGHELQSAHGSQGQVHVSELQGGGSPFEHWHLRLHD